MKDYFKSAIAYYFKWLCERGYSDPVKVIISDFLETVKITDEQKKYLVDKTNIKSNNVDSMIILIKKMRADGEIDSEALDLIEEGLRRLM
jgi:hypothetical protein